MRPRFTLVVVTSRDGFIGRTPTESPHTWASPEEQRLFLSEVAAADWAVMGRRTHEAADRPDRRRIVFSGAAGAGDWRRPGQLWLDPATLAPADLEALVSDVHPLKAGLILGGTRVHDWFLAHDAIDEVHLTVEPLTFDTGLPLFGAHRGDPRSLLPALGFTSTGETPLNPGGTAYSVWTPARS
ncbi:dihydrofolate reductase family protein [Histidinibacterium lentulum]|uniref:Dihydrofolate reductase n=1 Tax=Histidinibacterium lentulum TaxID=2480588 RepID=A0A3N2R753_9RHOB|nr:hypothetical protein [Histidinibacterium lentulum]ROU03309.1 hypothetical protein EAT49_03100 [Histidinibacterium lentulum]